MSQAGDAKGRIGEQLLEAGLIEEWQLVIKKRNDDPFDVDEILLNVSLSAAAVGQPAENVARDIQERVFQVCELRLNDVRVVELHELLELLGMETQLKEKRIVDLRPGKSSQESGPTTAE